VKKPPPGDDDAEVFAREMADVVPLRRNSKGRVKERPPVMQPPAPPRTADSAESDNGGVDFAASGVDRREIRRLRRGEYFPGDRLDLHGMNATDAGASVKRFIEHSRRAGVRCVCIVHGRGVHSAGNVPVLKTRVRELLRAGGAVLAYADAPRSDGGSGAVYVLLRK
jgi:DNA-nicking Smr family endonuclease